MQIRSLIRELRFRMLHARFSQNVKKLKNKTKKYSVASVEPNNNNHIICLGKSGSDSHSAVSNSLRPQASRALEFFRQEYWSGWPFPSPGDLPNSGIKSGYPTLQAGSLPFEPSECLACNKSSIIRAVKHSGA